MTELATPQPTHWRAALVGLAFAPVLAACAGGGGSHPGSASLLVTSTNATRSTAQAGNAKLPAGQAAALTVALTSSDTATVVHELAPAVRSAYAHKPFMLLPAAAKVVIDRTHLAVTGDSATVPATVTGSSAAGRWTLLLTRSGGRWLLYGTEKA